MNKEDYVSFDVAKILQKMGFESVLNCIHVYDDYGKLIDKHWRNNLSDPLYGAIEAPTLYEAQKWLREEHNINIEITTDVQYKDLWIYVIYDFRCCSTLDTNGGFNSYEEALNEGINNALEYI